MPFSFCPILLTICASSGSEDPIDAVLSSRAPVLVTILDMRSLVLYTL